MNKVIIPEWENVSNKLIKGKEVTPLELFIHGNEPAGRIQSSQFRRELLKAIEYCITQQEEQ